MVGQQPLCAAAVKLAGLSDVPAICVGSWNLLVVAANITFGLYWLQILCGQCMKLPRLHAAEHTCQCLDVGKPLGFSTQRTVWPTAATGSPCEPITVAAKKTFQAPQYPWSRSSVLTCSQQFCMRQLAAGMLTLVVAAAAAAAGVPPAAAALREHAELGQLLRLEAV